MDKDAKIKLLEKQLEAIQAKLEALKAESSPAQSTESPKLQERRAAFEWVLRGGSLEAMHTQGWSRTTVNSARLAADAFQQNADWVMDFSHTKKLIPQGSRRYFQTAHVFMWKYFPEKVRAHCASRRPESL